MAMAGDGPASRSARSLGAFVAAGPLGGLVAGVGTRIAMRIAAVTGGVPTEFRSADSGWEADRDAVGNSRLGPNGFRELNEIGHLWLNTITLAGTALLAGLVLDGYANRLEERRQSIVRAR